MGLMERLLCSSKLPGADGTSWPGPGFPGGCRQLTLAGRAILSKVSFLALPRTHICEWPLSLSLTFAAASAKVKFQGRPVAR